MFLTDHVALVTGGAQGIGWAVSQSLADHGARVFACDISEENIAQAMAEKASMPWGHLITLSPCDISDATAVDSWVAQVYAETGRIDVLVNNAVYVRWQQAATLSVGDSKKIMDVGYFGMIHTIKAVLPRMQAAQRGAIVNIGSSAGRLFVSPGTSSYSAMKAAVDAYTQILQIELDGSPISVTLVRPAVVAGTDFFRKSVSSNWMPRLGDWVPYVTPPQVARHIVLALDKRQKVVNIPGYLRLMYLGFALAPRFMRWLMRMGGNGRLDYGKVTWQYRPGE